MTAPSIPSFLTRFWTWLVSLAGVVGLYLGAVQLNVEVVFFIVAAVAILGAGIRPAVSWVVDVGTRYRNYPRLLEQVATLTTEVRNHHAASSVIPDATKEAYAQGVKEGTDRFRALIEGSIREPPALVGAKMSDGGDIVELVARYSVDAEHHPPSKYARYRLEVYETGECFGILGVSRFNRNRSLVYLYCIEPLNEQYWESLAKVVVTDVSAPSGMVLTSYTMPVDPFEEVEGEAVSSEAEEVR